MRLTALFLRSRLTGLALAWLAAAALLSWVWLVQWEARSLQVVELAVIALPLLPAAVIGASARSPFGEVEATASRPIPAFRVLHLAALIALGAAALAVAASVAVSGDLRLALARTLVGYAGLALLCGRLLGSRVAWLAPLGYAAVALYLDADSRWAWPRQVPVETWSLLAVALLAAAGLLAAARTAASDQLDEQ